MQTISLERFLRSLHDEVVGAIGKASVVSPPRLTIQVSFEAEVAADGMPAFRPVIVDAATTNASRPLHQLTLELELASAGIPARTPVAPQSPLATSPGPPPGDEPAGGGTASTLRRRLEFVLGGPPGFNTGARAEILADLLKEFGRQALVDAIESDWVTQFDTGIAPSPSVTPPTPTPATTALGPPSST